MSEFIIKNKYYIIIGLLIAFSTILVLVFALSQRKISNEVSNGNELDYSFLKKNLSQEDEHLMLLGKIVIESYGTYSYDDPRGLHEVINYATDSFKPRVQRVLDAVSPTTISVSLETDPDSIVLRRPSASEAVVTIKGIYAKGPQVETVTSEAFLVRVDEYWLVDNITVRSQKK